MAAASAATIAAVLEENSLTQEQVSVDVSLNIALNPKSDGESVQSVSLDIEPYLTITDESGDEGQLLNEKLSVLSAPVEITVVVGFRPELIRHYHESGSGSTVEYITPKQVTGNGDGTWTVTWEQSTFSTVELIAATRKGFITFAHADGSETKPYGEAQLGVALPESSYTNAVFTGWEIGSVRATSLTSELLDAIDGSTAAAPAQAVARFALEAAGGETVQWSYTAGTLTVSGVKQGDAVYVAEYDEAGRMLALSVLVGDGTVTPSGGAASVKLFWTDGNGAPRSASVPIK